VFVGGRHTQGYMLESNANVQKWCCKNTSYICVSSLKLFKAEKKADVYDELGRVFK